MSDDAAERPVRAVLHEVVEGLEADNGAGRLTNDQQALYGLARKLLEHLQGQRALR